MITESIITSIYVTVFVFIIRIPEEGQLLLGQRPTGAELQCYLVNQGRHQCQIVMAFLGLLNQIIVP